MRRPFISRLLTLLLLLTGAGKAMQAQVDPHFTQYYVYPSWLNPALTGSFDGDYRVSGIYRSQWGNISKPFRTVGLGGEFVTNNNVNIGIFTDIGSPCDHLALHFKHCHAAFLEANYDEEMLEKGSYPRHLKNRIRGGHGHLSNKQALEVFTKYKPAYMSHLFLSHLSKDNNSTQLVQQ